MKFITLDFETFFSPQCNIKKLGTSQYVQHPDFHCLTMAWKTPNMKHAQVLVGDEIDDFFDRLRPHAKRVVLCGHHLHFDGYVASYHYRFVPFWYVCTLAMAQPHHSQYRPVSLESLAQHYQLGDGEGKIKGVLDEWKGLQWEDADEAQREELCYYNRIDTELTEQLARELLPLMPRFELDIIDMTIRMFTDPAINIDAAKARQIINEEVEAKDSALISVFGDKIPLDGLRTKVRSNPGFAELLHLLSVEPPMKISPTTGEWAYAFAKADLPFQALEHHEDERVRKLYHARVTNKTSINQTRAQAMLDRSNAAVPLYLKYCSAHTFRFGGGDGFNPQNLPRDGRLRSCLRAPEGYLLVAADASQIEARDTAVFSEQWDLVDEFAAGVDVYSSFASDIYGFPVDKENNPKERFVGKTGILGLGFQCGAFKFQNMLEVGAMGPPVDISFAEAEKIVQAYRKKYYCIKETWRELQNMIPFMMHDSRNGPKEFRGLVFEPGGTLLMPNGLRMHYPDLGYEVGDYGTAEFSYRPYDGRYKKQIHKKLYGGALLENCIQSRCRTITTGHALALSKYYKVVLLVHDEIIMCVPKAQAETCLRDALEIMSEPPDWNPQIPLAAEGTITEHYIK